MPRLREVENTLFSKTGKLFLKFRAKSVLFLFCLRKLVYEEIEEKRIFMEVRRVRGLIRERQQNNMKKPSAVRKLGREIILNEN